MDMMEVCLKIIENDYGYLPTKIQSLFHPKEIDILFFIWITPSETSPPSMKTYQNNPHANPNMCYYPFWGYVLVEDSF